MKSASLLGSLSISMAVVLLLTGVPCVCLAVPQAVCVQPGRPTQQHTAEPSPLRSTSGCVGHVGRGPQGLVLFGFAGSWVSESLWLIRPDGGVVRQFVTTESLPRSVGRGGAETFGWRSLASADTGGGQSWVAGNGGLYRLEGTDLASVRYIRIDRDPVSGKLLIATVLGGGETAQLTCRSVVVDAQGRPWAHLQPTYGELWGFAAPESAAGGAGGSHAAVRWGAGPIAAAPSATRGVWAYAIRHGTATLEHLDVTGHGSKARIASLERVGGVQIPGLAAPCMAVSADAGVVVTGQTRDGDQMVRYRNGEVSATDLPTDLFHSRHVTALDAGADGRIYAATDGAGVMVLDGNGWQAHPITAHLPTIAGTDLKPVDDILVTEDGTVYAACQTQLVIWRPDGDEE